MIGAVIAAVIPRQPVRDADDEATRLTRAERLLARLLALEPALDADGLPHLRPHDRATLDAILGDSRRFLEGSSP